METKYSIKDLEQLSGIKAHTIRAWESRYKLIEPHRTPTNIRYYVDQHLKKILNISVLIRAGMRISQVAEMSDDEIRSAVVDTGRYQGNYDSQINAFKIAMLEFDEYLFDSVFNKCLLQFGTDNTLTKILGTFIQEVGTLWQVGAISVSNEHFISNLIKQKLFALIDQTILSRTGQHRKSYVLYLPGEELHEMGLLYLNYYLKRKGYRVIYLGQSVPIEYVKEAADKTGINHFITVFTTRPHYEEIDVYFEKLTDIFDLEKYEFFVYGQQLLGFDHAKKPSHVKIASDLQALISIL